MILFRYERNIFYDTDQEARLVLEVYHTIKETKKGFWIYSSPMKKRFVLKEGKKRFAYQTKEEALMNFIERTKSCIRFNKHYLRKAKAFLIVAEAVQYDLKNPVLASSE
jgi:hypothetical protein